MRRSPLLTLLLYVMLIVFGMMIGYALAASYYSAPPFKPDVQESRPTSWVMSDA
jgi:hypothetical protein